MSYDISIGNEDFNYTSNVAALFYDHIPDSGKGGGLKELDGVQGKEAFLILGDGFHSLYQTYISLPRMCVRYDSKNGWGSVFGSIQFLANMMAACVRNPREKVQVSF